MRFRRKNKRQAKARLHRDGTVTISGLSFQDAQAVFTEAWLYRNAHKVKPDEETGPLADVIHESNLEELAWERRITWCIDSVLNSLREKNAWRPVLTPAEQIAARWKAVRGKQEIDRWIKEIFEQAIQRRQDGNADSVRPEPA